ncbi:helix-turn-helix domain-containing protein [Streptomyces sp. NPDC059506]|uniref:helix-turn-helix domain-containing protein n=1 Tax=Streptomyces sp. NPDC059506 TaxID=3347751 RepID=UPI0036A3ECA4
MSRELAAAVRNYRRRAGLTQEGLAAASGLSPSVVCKVEQGGEVRVDTLHALARGLGVPTSALFTTEALEPVVGDEANQRYLVELRRELMPPVGLSGRRVSEVVEPPDLSAVSREVDIGYSLHRAGRYGGLAKKLPSLLNATAAAAELLKDEEQERVVEIRSRSLLLAGSYLTQVRQYDLAYHALAEGIRTAREADRTFVAAMGVSTMCWLLLRQDRFDESEQLAATTALAVEPKFSAASPDQLAAWGDLSLRMAAAAVRNNRPDVAREARRMASTAAGALGTEYTDNKYRRSTFGPVTAEMKAVEDLSVLGDARGVLRRSDDGLLSPGSVSHYGRPSPAGWNRHRLDVAKAHAALGSHQEAMDELTALRRTSPEWLKHQTMARHVMSDILRRRKRTLTRDMREMAAHLAVVG